VKKDKSLSVCFFSHSAQLAGAEKVLLELVTQLVQDHGATCSAVLPRDGPLKQRLKKLGVSTHITRYYWSWRPELPPEEEAKTLYTNSAENLLYSVKEVIATINPDIVVTNSMVIPWGAIAASFLGKPHVWFIHEFGEKDHGYKPSMPFGVALDFISNLSDLVITNSDAVRKTLFPGAGSKKVLTVYPYVSIPETAVCQDNGGHFSSASLARLVMSGRVQEGKGQKDAILAVKELVAWGREVELLIMGDCASDYGEQLKAIVKEEKLEERVKFIGFTDNPYPIMKQADIVLVCSRSEAFGLVTAEGMLLKRPVIGTNRGGTPELVKDGFNGLLYEPGDYKQLAAKIEYLMDHPDDAKRLAENGYEFARKTFTKSKFGGKVYQLLKGLKRKAASQASYPNLTLEGPAILDALLYAAATRDPKVAALVTELGSSLFTKDARIGSLETSLREKVVQIHRSESEIRRLESQIEQIQHSIPMQLANRYQGIVAKLLRPGTRRRRSYELMLSGVRVILNEGWRSFWARFKDWLLRRSMSPEPEHPPKAAIPPDISSGSLPLEKPALAPRYNPRLQGSAQLLTYDVSGAVLRRNWEVIEKFRKDPHLEPNRVLWILPGFDHIYRGGIYTIFRVADSFSRQFGTINIITLHGGANVALPKVETMIRSAFPSLKFELTRVSRPEETERLPPSDAAFCTLWTTAYILVRYNKCKGKFYFVQDFEPAFSAASSTYGLIEQTYRFGFVGIANTPGVGELYRQYNPWVQYFIPGVDKSIFYPKTERSIEKRIRRIVFYGRPGNNRNAFELGAASLSLVKNELGNMVEITSVGSDFAESEYGVQGILKNRGVLRSLEEIAALYRSSDVGLVFMYTAHPSYQPFEFMASGCATVSNFNRYTQWFLRDGENAALAHSTPTCIAERILGVLQDEELRHKIIEGGLKTVATLEWDAALERITKFVCHPSPSRSQFLSEDMHLYGTTI
jgi:glycosyltransferase involved in cell wall biosynthesis